MVARVARLLPVLVIFSACGGGGSNGTEVPSLELPELAITEVEPSTGWIEIRNDGDAEASTADVRLETAGGALLLTTATLLSGERLVVDVPGGLPAPGFALLRHATGVILDGRDWPGLPSAASSHQRTASGWRATDPPTRAAAEPAGDLGPLVNEVLANGAGGTAWIELVNPGDVDLALDGFGLTDDPADPLRWTFPRGPSSPGRSASWSTRTGTRPDRPACGRPSSSPRRDRSRSTGRTGDRATAWPTARCRSTSRTAA